MKTLAIVQARMGSTRVPGKVMRDLMGLPVFMWTVTALKQADVGKVILATSTLPADDVIAEECRKRNVPCFRGSEDDVLDRFYQCAKQEEADVILRLTADCPYIDPDVVRQVVRLRELEEADYASNIDPPSYPDGLDVECFTFRALQAAWKEATRPSDRDCVPQFIVRNRSRFPSANLACPLPLGHERWVLDTEADWRFCHALAEQSAYPGRSFSDILAILDHHPEIRSCNADGIRNERFFEAVNTERLPARTFERSARVFRRAIKHIPFGAQTFSKSHIQFPQGRAPLYCSHADGARIFDVDGNDYIDLVSAVLPVVLGYRDHDVDRAIIRSLDRGISFSLATELESELAERLCHHIPCAEQVKFGKSGTDVTTAAVRLARAYTGRDLIFQSGYHGWADWSMAATDRNKGIPEAVKALSKRIVYGDFEDAEYAARDKPAAFIVEPNDNQAYLQYLRKLCDENGIVLIFDEIITGFRYALGGAQKLYGVTPDLACFGKAMANGMPISAVVGREKIMRLCAPPDNIFYSGTMFGETLSIAAAIETIDKIEREKVIEHLWWHGAKLKRAIGKLLHECGLDDAVTISGEPPRSMLAFHDVSGASANQLRTMFMQEMIQGGVLIINSNNITFAHRKGEIRRIEGAYTQAFSVMAETIKQGDIAARVGEVVEAAPLRATA